MFLIFIAYSGKANDCNLYNRVMEWQVGLKLWCPLFVICSFYTFKTVQRVQLNNKVKQSIKQENVEGLCISIPFAIVRYSYLFVVKKMLVVKSSFLLFISMKFLRSASVCSKSCSLQTYFNLTIHTFDLQSCLRIYGLLVETRR